MKDSLEPNRPGRRILDRVSSPSDLKALSLEECKQLAAEMRSFIVDAVSVTGGHLGSNLGAVELTIALHRVFDSPNDVILFDTGHQAYVHKILTGRAKQFATLRQAGGLSGYPRRAESPHDVIENSHASTALSWAHGIAVGKDLEQGASKANPRQSHVVAVVGDGALTGGMAYEALNNLGHSSSRVVIVLNDNGRSYAPTISKLSGSLTHLRLDPRYVQIRERVRELLRELPSGVGSVAYTSVHGLTSALREIVEPHVFFEALGVRYTGPLDGHDIAQVEQALRRASAWPGPIVLHLLTKKGKGYAPAEQDEVAKLHDLKVVSSRSDGVIPTSSDFGADLPVSSAKSTDSYTEAFTRALLSLADDNDKIVAITAAMPGPTGLLSFEKAHPDRFFDVGIAEQHAMTAAAGMARQGLRPVVCIYSTFLQRCVDQWNLDVGLHKAPVVVVADRAGITGDDGPSHHGIYDIHSALCIPDVAVYCPSEPAEVGPLLKEAVNFDGPSLIRYPKTTSPGPLGPPGEPGHHRVLIEGDDKIVMVGIGKLARDCVEAALIITEESGLRPLVIDPRVIRPAPRDLIELLCRASLVVTAEDGLANGGAGTYLTSLVDEQAARKGIFGPRALVLGVPVGYHAHGKPDDILSSLGLDGPGIATALLEAARRYGLAEEAEEPSVGEDPELSTSRSTS
ncbi:MAG: 1-deoxy-D-xylulose-5-phosphate synthase [Acidimicrobiales bacterium]